jgi:hypothetical protein
VVKLGTVERLFEPQQSAEIGRLPDMSIAFPVIHLFNGSAADGANAGIVKLRHDRAKPGDRRLSVPVLPPAP